MAAFFKTTYPKAFSCVKVYELSIMISLRFVPKGTINNIPALA